METNAKIVKGFYYDQLDIDGQCLYGKVARAVSSMEELVAQEECPEESVYQVMMAVKYDNPELFYWDPQKSEVKEDGIFLHYDPSDEKEVGDLLCALRKARRALIVYARLSESDQKKKDCIQKIYEYMAEHYGYAEEELLHAKENGWIYDIRGPLLKKKGVCLGYGLAMNYLCQALHIPSVLVTGEAQLSGSKVNHGWNLLRPDDTWLHLDITGELCEGDGSHQKYLFLTDTDPLLQDRGWDREIYPKTDL